MKLTEKSYVENNNIKIAFCFDGNLKAQACVAVANLIDASVGKGVHYDIYCICDESASQIEHTLKEIAYKKDKKTNIFVKQVKNMFKDGYEIRGITAGAYLRLQLHKELPDIDKIIYSDVDIFFYSDLQELWNMEMAGNIVMGVKSRQNLESEWKQHLNDFKYWEQFKKNSYINSGLLLMNLSAIRKSNIEKEWLELYKKDLFYQDQDIVNLTCQNKIGYIPPKYIKMQSKIENKDKYIANGIFSENEMNEMIENPVITHYAGPKPWDNKNVFDADLWINYVRSQPDLRKICKDLPVFIKKLFKKTKNDKGRRKIYLFGIKILSYTRKEKGISNIFTKIYKNNSWGNSESRSGNTSTIARTQNLREQLPIIVKKYNIKTFLDAPCGDLNWMSKLIDDNTLGANYIGADIVDEMININKNKYKNKDNIKFYCIDIIKDALPKSDIMMTRDCLFHLSEKDIFKFLNNFVNSDIDYLLTTTHINQSKFQNTDIKTGGWRYLDLHIEPYNFPKPLESIIDGGGDRYLSLFLKSQIYNVLLNNNKLVKNSIIKVKK